MLKTNDLAVQAKGATLRFLKRKGYGILDSDSEDFGAVVEDDGCIVFVVPSRILRTFPTAS